MRRFRNQKLASSQSPRALFYDFPSEILVWDVYRVEGVDQMASPMGTAGSRMGTAGKLRLFEDFASERISLTLMAHFAEPNSNGRRLSLRGRQSRIAISNWHSEAELRSFEFRFSVVSTDLIFTRGAIDDDGF